MAQLVGTSYLYQKQVKPDQLTDEINASGLIGLQTVILSSDGVSVEIDFSSPLGDADKSTLDTVVANHVPKAEGAVTSDIQNDINRIATALNDSSKAPTVRAIILGVIVPNMPPASIQAIIDKMTAAGL